MKAGFAEVDITPEPGVKKIGWMEDLRGDVILDGLAAVSAVFENGASRLGFIQLDTLSVRWTQTNNIRKKIEKRSGFPGENIMVSATHNHAGPAVAGVCPVMRDEDYIRYMEDKCVECFCAALGSTRAAELAFGSAKNFRVAHNRRSRMRDGSVKSQAASDNPMFMCMEGPADPEIAVLAARGGGNLLGCIVNYACHPVHHGGGNEISSGFPGVMRRRLRDAGCAFSLYLNGAYGNVITADYESGVFLSKEEAGDSLAEDVAEVLGGMEFSASWGTGASSRKMELPYRRVTDDERRGRVFGAQRFRGDELYEDYIRTLEERIKERKAQPAEIQVLKLGDVFFAGVPAEYFVEFQLDMKEKFFPRRVLTVGGANGMVGYVPTEEAFSRGGYETTLGPPSRMAPEAGGLIMREIGEIIEGLDCNA